MFYLSLQLLVLTFAANPINHFQDTANKISQVGYQLEKGISVDKVLQDTSLMFLHPNGQFRSLIKKFSATGELTIVSATEPGERIRIVAHLKDKKGNPITNALIYFYQTDDRGYYGMNTNHVAGNEGDRRHARLFGYSHTDNKGRLVLNTIHPRGYPNSTLPSHIHCEVFVSDSAVKITELLFDEDPRLTPEQRARSQSEGFIIARKNRDQYEYVVEVENR